MDECTLLHKDWIIYISCNITRELNLNQPLYMEECYECENKDYTDITQESSNILLNKCKGFLLAFIF